MRQLKQVKWRILGFVCSLLLCAYGLHAGIVTLTLVFLVPSVGFGILLGEGLEQAEDRFYCETFLCAAKEVLRLYGPGPLFEQYRHAMLQQVTRNVYYASAAAQFSQQLDAAVLDATRVGRSFAPKGGSAMQKIPLRLPVFPDEVPASGLPLEPTQLSPEPTKSLRAPRLVENDPWASYVMTAEEQEAQRISFVYGNLKLSNPDITKDQVVDAAKRLRGEV